MLKCAAITLSILFASLSYSAPADALSIDDILALSKAGITESIIVARIRQAGKPFALSTDELIKLKQASISDQVIRVMIDPASPEAAITATTAAIPGSPTINTSTVGDPNDPASPHESGIYIHTKDRSGVPKMIPLERAAYQGQKTKGGFLSVMTSGIKKAKVSAMIPGPTAGLRIDEPSPTFYFYFEDKAAGLGRGLLGANLSSPNQFVLIRLDVTGAGRETTIMEAGAFGMSQGTDSKSAVSFRSERIRSGVYRVFPLSPLRDGEYCFLAGIGVGGAGAAAAVDIFDFSVAAQ